MTITDWELWACANEMIRQHGEDAGTQAAMKADALLAKSDLDGVRTWQAIMRRIGELHAAPAGDPN